MYLVGESIYGEWQLLSAGDDYFFFLVFQLIATVTRLKSNSPFPRKLKYSRYGNEY